MDNKKIETMSAAGTILGEVMQEVLDFIRPGVTELEIDNLAEKLILKKGGTPGFKRVPGYHHTICISTNDVVVHGIPTARIIAEDDIVGIDCGVFLNGYHTDMAETRRVSTINNSHLTINDEVDKFLAAGKKACFSGIMQAKPGNRVGHISDAIQKVVEGNGYAVVRSLVGHGVGKKLHEAPEIPGYLHGPIEKTPKLTPGMTIAVEVIYNMGKQDVTYSNDDDWTITSADGSLSGLFERTILVGTKGPELLTKLVGDSSL